MEMLEANLEEILEEIQELRETQGLLTKDQYFELIDEVLEEKRELGELADDFNFAGAKEVLRRKWDQVEPA